MINIFGIHIYEFSIVFSDFILCIESAIFAYLFYKHSNRELNFKTIECSGFFLFLFLSTSSLFGVIFHSFFPEKTATMGGFLVWMLTAVSIGLTAAVVWYINAYLLDKRRVYKIINYFVSLFLITYLFTIFFVDYHYPTIIMFYAPPILILGIIALIQCIKVRQTPWLYLFIGIVLSISAAGVQALHISLDDVYFNFNTLYHIIQGAGLVFLYISLSKLAESFDDRKLKKFPQI